MTSCTHCDIGRHRYLGPIHSDPFHIVFEDVFPCTKEDRTEDITMVPLQSVRNALCHHCMVGTAFEDAESYPPNSFHEWWQDGRHVGRVRCAAADLCRQLLSHPRT